MRLSIFFRSFLALFLTFLLISESKAQLGYGFGQNKVRYKDFDWSVYRTEHFDVHYYPGMEESAHDAARMAERGYTYLSSILNHEIKFRIPLILYASMNDFQQTNVIQGMLGEGTRGVTESGKSRVILPITGSYRQFNHVLVHELVHAFQFDMMRALSKGNRGFNMPLWAVEGMAEYLSNLMESSTKMWIRDGLDTEELLTVKELNSTYDIRVYRLGQALWYYVGETFGKEKVTDIFKSALSDGGLEKAFEMHIGMNADSLTKNWHEAMKSLVYYTDTEFIQPDSIAEKITRQESYFHRMNLIPTVSPDGSQIAYIANKNLKDEIYILSRSDQGDYKPDRLIQGGQSKMFEALNIFESSMDWSRDGKLITFITKSGKDDALYIMSPEDKKIIHRFVFEDLNGLQSPTFSPDAREIAFVGMRGGRSDLYTINLENNLRERLTNDRHAVLHPHWSPNGRYIAYATDLGPGTDEDRLLFGDYDIALFDLESSQTEVITSLPGNAINPQWLPDSDQIFFLSDHDLVPNIYKIDIAGKVITEITRLHNGVGGITESTPAFSLSKDGSTLVFSIFQNSSWQIFRLETPFEGAVPGEQFAEKVEPIHLDEEQSQNIGDKNTFDKSKLILTDRSDPNTIYANYELADMDSVESKDFKNRLSLDGVMLAGSFGGYFGSIAGAQMLFTDMMGNNTLFLTTGVRFSDLLRSDLGVTYFNQSNRFNYGIQLYQLSNAFGAFLTFDEIGFIRQTYRGGSLFSAYPFSRFSRIELSAGITNVEQDLIVDNFSGDQQTSALGSLSFGQFGTALVYDNTIYGPLGPLAGQRSRLSIEQAVNDLEFTTIFADHRRYKNIGSRTVLAYRLMGGTSTGSQAQIFRIGGPFSYRGRDYGEMIGTRFLVQNLEYRFPLLPFLSPGSDYFSAFTFFDAAAAWGIDVPGLIKKDFQPFSTSNGFGLNDLQSAIGLGARLNLGYFTFQYYGAWETDFRGIAKPRFQFSLGSLF